MDAKNDVKVPRSVALLLSLSAAVLVLVLLSLPLRVLLLIRPSLLSFDLVACNDVDEDDFFDFIKFDNCVDEVISRGRTSCR